jgi:transcriptional regulator with XRE-family HTH domain
MKYGLSAHELGRLAGLSPAHVSYIERSDVTVNARTLQAIARVFGVTLDWLYLRKGRAPNAGSIARAVAAAKSAALAKSVQSASKTKTIERHSS